MNVRLFAPLVVGPLLAVVTTFANLNRAPQSASQAGTQASLVQIPADVPADAARYSVLIMGNSAGANIRWKTADGTWHTFFSYNDRGRGPRLVGTYTLGANGALQSFQVSGNDYLKTPVSESFAISAGRATWNNQAEHGERSVPAPALYVPMNGSPIDASFIVSAALANGGAVPLLPEGEARVEKVAQRAFEANGMRVTATEYGISGLDLAPIYIWLDERNEAFAAGDSWTMTIAKGWEPAVQQVLDAQLKTARRRAEDLASRLAHAPGSVVALANVNVFDSASARVVPAQTVIVRGNKIESVTAAAAALPPGAVVIDGTGQTLLPGLWDMHAHVSDYDGLLNLAAGVTTVRDLANDTDELEARRKRIDAGHEVGTRIFPAGFIDGPGPYQAPTKALAANEQQAREYVRKYAALGYRQIKIYSSLKPELVPAIVDEAHKHGMRISGHVPAGMVAADGVLAGMDEIQHANYLLLNFLPDVKSQTMTPARFTEVAKRGAEVDVSSRPVQEFIALLKQHHVAIDPTLAVFETMFLGRAGQIPDTYSTIASRLPAQFRRGLLTGGLPVPPGMDQRYKDSFERMLQLVKAMYDAGIEVESGTDALAGFTLDRELELHVKAGIPASRVLGDATLGAARIMKADATLGSIAPGKLADLVLVKGDPTARIADVRSPTLVMKDGIVYRPAELLKELGIR